MINNCIIIGKGTNHLALLKLMPFLIIIYHASKATAPIKLLEVEVDVEVLVDVVVM